MNRQEAINYNNDLKDKLEIEALNCNLDSSIGAYIVDNFIIILPEDARKGMIFLGENPASFKIYNVKIDLKKAIVAGLELAASINEPETIFNYIQLAIVSFFFIGKSVKQKLSRMEAVIVYLLHKKNAYDTGVKEEKLVFDVQTHYKQKEGMIVEKDKIEYSINNLYSINAIEIINGIIYLNEYVWGSVE